MDPSCSSRTQVTEDEAFAKSVQGTDGKASREEKISINARKPDNTKCSCCATKFNIFNHRHICQKCKRGVCNKCSLAKKVLLAYRQPKRVCDTCVSRFSAPAPVAECATTAETKPSKISLVISAPDCSSVCGDGPSTASLTPMSDMSATPPSPTTPLLQFSPRPKSIPRDNFFGEEVFMSNGNNGKECLGLDTYIVGVSDKECSAPLQGTTSTEIFEEVKVNEKTPGNTSMTEASSLLEEGPSTRSRSHTRSRSYTAVDLEALLRDGESDNPVWGDDDWATLPQSTSMEEDELEIPYSSKECTSMRPRSSTADTSWEVVLEAVLSADPERDNEEVLSSSGNSDEKEGCPSHTRMVTFSPDVEIFGGDDSEDNTFNVSMTSGLDTVQEDMLKEVAKKTPYTRPRLPSAVAWSAFFDDKCVEEVACAEQEKEKVPPVQTSREEDPLEVPSTLEETSSVPELLLPSGPVSKDSISDSDQAKVITSRMSEDEGLSTQVLGGKDEPEPPLFQDVPSFSESSLPPPPGCRVNFNEGHDLRLVAVEGEMDEIFPSNTQMGEVQPEPEASLLIPRSSSSGLLPISAAETCLTLLGGDDTVAVMKRETSSDVVKDTLKEPARIHFLCGVFGAGFVSAGICVALSMWVGRRCTSVVQ
ncbi:unnamed protein product [Choristocarpus tenellus]